jgi:uncharacterized protein (DUF2345 family)
MRGVGNGFVSIKSNSGDDVLRIADDWILLHSHKNNRPLGLEIDATHDKVNLINNGGIPKITLTKENISIDSENEIEIEGKILTMVNASGKCKIYMEEEKIEIICTPAKGPLLGVSFDPILQSIDIDAGDASIILAKDVIHFSAERDINITSKNGNVNIKGKKVKVNE